MTPTQEQIDNRRKLISYLRGELKASFDMRSFSDFEFDSIPFEAEYCGTIGCAVGHGPYAGVKKNKGEGWSDYSERAFGVDSFSYEWEYSFGEKWVQFDNTATGAANRLEQITDNNFTEEEIESMIPWHR